MKIARYTHKRLNESHRVAGTGMNLELAWSIFDTVCKRLGWAANADDIKVEILENQQIHEIK